MKIKVIIIPALAIVAMAVLVFAAACGGGDPEDLTFDVTIEHDAWDVSDDIIKVKQGDHVTINVESDEQGGFHLHGYDLYNEVAPGEPMTFEFTADATGNFEIQFHKFTMASDEPEMGEDMADGEMVDDHDAGEHEMGGETELHLGSLQVFPR